MVIEKSFLGSAEVIDKKIRYYLLKKNDIYGIELIEEEKEGQLYAEIEYFAENYESAYQLGMLMKDGEVTICTMSTIIDDYVA